MCSDYEDLEVIIVDDSGERYAEPVIEKWDVHAIYHEENKGAQKARETGIRSATGKYVQLLDDDEQLFDKKIAKQVEALETSKAKVCYCGVQQPDGTLHFPKYDGNVLNEALALDLFPAITSSLLVEMELLSEILPLVDIPGAQDDWLKIELAIQSEYIYVNEILVERKSPSNRISDSIGVLKGRLYILNNFSHLYSEAPDWVKQTAKEKTYHFKGKYLINKYGWSLDGLRCFIKAYRYSPESKPKHIKAFAVSIAGRPGLELGYKIALFRQRRRSKTGDKPGQ